MKRLTNIILVTFLLLSQAQTASSLAAGSCCLKEKCSCISGLCCTDGKCKCSSGQCCKKGKCVCSEDCGKDGKCSCPKS